MKYASASGIIMRQGTATAVNTNIVPNEPQNVFVISRSKLKIFK